MVSLDKTPLTISLGRLQARINAGLRRNNLLALSLDFSERAYRADVVRFEAHKAQVLGR
ncbi:hypothetical protein ACIPX0_26450 [Streptomyces sp. NPDC090075]|uniref:hypothetical protein n=1 Tax=Streptomyces sp. NPDC090075 TaxID=3365937 RepID=UPI0037FDA69B